MRQKISKIATKNCCDKQYPSSSPLPNYPDGSLTGDHWRLRVTRNLKKIFCTRSFPESGYFRATYNCKRGLNISREHFKYWQRSKWHAFERPLFDIQKSNREKRNLNEKLHVSFKLRQVSSFTVTLLVLSWAVEIKYTVYQAQRKVFDAESISPCPKLSRLIVLFLLRYLFRLNWPRTYISV